MLLAARLEFDSRQGPWFYLLTTASRPALGPTQSPIQWVLGALSWGQGGRGVKLATHLYLVLRSRMLGATPPLPQYASMAWCSVKAQGQLYLYLFFSTGFYSPYRTLAFLNGLLHPPLPFADIVCWFQRGLLYLEIRTFSHSLKVLF
jgi:hypothetical protein